MNKQVVVLDWDGTLVFSRPTADLIASDSNMMSLSSFKGYVSLDRNGVEGETAIFVRPGVEDFLTHLAQEYQLMLWSFGVRSYIRQCMKKTGIDHFFSKIIVREDMKIHIKDLYALKIPLTRVVVVDDANESFGVLNPYNCIDISTWTPYEEDDITLRLIPHVIAYHFRNVLSKKSHQELVNLRSEIIRNIQRLQVR